MSQQLENDIKQVEMTIEHAQELVRKGKLAEKLADNPDFKEIIIEGFIFNEAVRLAHLIGDPTVIDPNIVAVCKRDIHAPGALKRYLSAMVTIGHNAANELLACEIELDDLRNEELNQDD